MSGNNVSFAPFNSWQGKLASKDLSLEEQLWLMQYLQQVRKRLKLLFTNPKIDQVITSYKIGETGWKKLSCYIGWFHTRIKIDGTVLPCHTCSLVLGNLLESDFGEIWNGPAYRNFRRRTYTRAGLPDMRHHCDCGFCCHLINNVQIRRCLRWFSPFPVGQRSRRLRRDPGAGVQKNSGQSDTVGG